VVYANGKKQAVGVDQFFKAGDIWFQLMAVDPKTMKIAVVDGSFTGGKHAITIKRGHPVTLVNTATGVEYTLRFTQATSGIATTASTKPVDAPAGSTPAATTPATGDTASPDPTASTMPTGLTGTTTTTSIGS